MKQAVILAGGLGTRLRAQLGDLPKPMIPFAGKPLLEHQVALCVRHGLRDIVIFACYRADLIEAHFGDGRRWGASISYVVEREPLGTAGAVLAGFEKLADEFVVLYGDTMVNVDLTRLAQAHARGGADATLLLHPNNHPHDSDLVEVDPHGLVTAFHNRPHLAGRWFQNLVNAGLYIVCKSALRPWAAQPAKTAAASARVNGAARASLAEWNADSAPAIRVTPATRRAAAPSASGTGVSVMSWLGAISTGHRSLGAPPRMSV